MTENQRKIKKTIIASFYIVIHVSILGFFIFLLWPKNPPAVIEPQIIPNPLEVIEYIELKLPNGRSDFVARVSNPNDDFGVNNVKYTFILQNSAGEEQRITREFYVLPGNKNTLLLALNIDVQDYQLASFELDSDLEWVGLSRFNLPELVVRNTRLEQSDRIGAYLSASGVVTNQSSFGLRRIDVIVVLENSSGDIIGVNQTFVRDVVPQEARDFDTIWDVDIDIPEDAETVYYPYTNVLNDRQFIVRESDGPVDDF